MAAGCDPRFIAVEEAFERNFAERDELGASVCITVDGETVVDLWDGYADESKSVPWQSDTVSVVWSVTKTIVATCAHVLVARGEVDLDEPIVKYWPEYGTSSSKRSTTVADTLSHLAGQPAIRADVPPGALYDWEWVTDALATQEPLWEPGTKSCYHVFTFGYLPGEVVRRVTGQTVGQFLQSEIARPLGLDCWLGLPEEIEPRVAPMVMNTATESENFDHPAINPDSVGLMAMTNMWEHYHQDGVNSRRAHAAELPSAGALSNARSLAGLYRPLALGGSVDGVRLVNRETLARMSNTVTGNSADPLLGFAVRYSLGYWRSMDNRRRFGTLNSFIVGRSAFGHAGAGGILAFADPDARMSMGYTMNRMGDGGGLNRRGQSLIDAAYRCLGYTTNAPGFWIK